MKAMPLKPTVICVHAENTNSENTTFLPLSLAHLPSLWFFQIKPFLFFLSICSFCAFSKWSQSRQKNRTYLKHLKHRCTRLCKRNVSPSTKNYNTHAKQFNWFLFFRRSHCRPTRNRRKVRELRPPLLSMLLCMSFSIKINKEFSP